MTVYKYEFKKNIKSISIWSIALLGLTFMFMAIFPSFASDNETMELMLENYPEEMLKAFGMNTGLPLSTILGYGVFMFGFNQLIIAMQASNYGFSILSVEERELTADFLMTKPVSRKNIIVSKFLAVESALMITNIVYWLGVIASIELFKGERTYDFGVLLIYLSTNILFQLFFVIVGMLVSVSVTRIRSVLSYSMALAFGMYILNAVRSIIDGEILGYLTPFYYFEPGYIMEHGHYNYGLTLMGLLLIVSGTGVTYLLYQKRDIHSL